MKINTSKGGNLSVNPQKSHGDKLNLIFGCGALSSQAFDAKLGFPN